MKNELMPMADKILLRKRALIETVNDQLKNISQVEYTRHRSITGFMLDVLGALTASTYQEKNLSAWGSGGTSNATCHRLKNKFLFIKQ